MAINIKFDSVGNPDTPTIVLANRNGNKLGQLDINPESIELIDKFNAPSEISFTVNKYVDSKIANLWDELVDFKLVYCKEWLVWFEIKVELDEATESVKTVFCTQLGQAELSQTMLYNIEINTEDDIAREDYKITKFYNSENSKASLLHRLLEKAPHYSVDHIDYTLEDIQRSFSFDDISIYDAFQEIAEEIGCLFVFNSDSDKNGMPKRTISVYDLQQNCKSCDYRGEFTDVCPKCGETDKEKIRYGYGVDTSIFVTSDELASNGIQLTTDTDSVKNCFKLEAGDDLMTATIRNRNPNGSDYIWYFSDATKADMPDKLVKKIEEYDDTYRKYYNDYLMKLNSNKYNKLIKRYKKYDEDLEQIPNSIKGFASLMNAYYNTIDLSWFLRSGLMPSVSMSKTNAEQQANLLSISLPSLIAVANLKSASLSTADSTVLAMAKAIVSSSYKVSIVKNSSSLKNGTWSGNFTITNYSDENDTYTTKHKISRTLTDWDETYIQQKIEKMLSKENTDNLDITGLFEKEYTEFCEKLKEYALTPLTSIHDACQACIDILVEQGSGNKDSWVNSDTYKERVKSDTYKETNNTVVHKETNSTAAYRETGTYKETGSYNSYKEIVSFYKDGDLSVMTKSPTSVLVELNLKTVWNEYKEKGLRVIPKSSTSIEVCLDFNSDANGVTNMHVRKADDYGNILNNLSIKNISIEPGEHYSSHTIKGLSPNTEYTITCDCGAFGGEYFVVTFTTPPAAEILVRKANDYGNILDNLSVKNISIEVGEHSSKHTIAGLSPNTEYAVTCDCEAFGGEYSVVTFTTPPNEMSSTEAPHTEASLFSEEELSNEIYGDLTVMTQSNGSIFVELEFSATAFGTAEILVRKANDYGNILDNLSVKNISIEPGEHYSKHTIKGLSSGAEYIITCDCGAFGGEYSQATFTMPFNKVHKDLIVTTKSPTSAQVDLNFDATWDKYDGGDLTITPQSSTSVFVELEFSATAFGTAEILVRKANDYGNILDNLSVKNISIEPGEHYSKHTIKGLSSGTEYIITCDCGAFGGEYSQATFTTPPTTEVLVRKADDYGNILDNLSIKNISIKIGEHSSKHTIAGLSPNTEYIISCNCLDFGGEYHQVTFTTPPNEVVENPDGTVENIKIYEETYGETYETYPYSNLYEPYYDKLKAIEAEMKVREEEISTVTKLQTDIEELKVEIQNELDFEKYLDDLWLEFCAYRREDKYRNANYISDGLNNAELFKRALEFYEVAENEIFKSSELQHSITATLNNLLAIPKFKPLVDSFEVGNWIRVQIDDNIYKLRLIEYTISYDDFSKISVEFSDVAKVRNGYSDLESILSDASSMASSYDSIQRQASSGDEARNMIRKWLNEGLDASLVQIQNNTNEDIVIDNNGLIGRSYSDITDEYSDEQIRLTHNIIAYTDDNWKSVKQAIGKHKFKKFDEGKKAFIDDIGYGMSAEFVSAGFISGSQIIGGDIYSDNYLDSKTKKTGSHIDLRSGEFSFGGGALTFDGEKLTISSDNSNITEITEDWLKTGTVFATLIKGVEISADQITTGSLEGQTIIGGTIKGTTIEGGTIKGIKISSTSDITTTLTAVDINTSTLTGNTITGGTITGSDVIGGQVYVTGEGAEKDSALYICNGYTIKTDAEDNIIEKKPNVVGFISYDSHGKSDNEIYDGKYIAQERIIFETSMGMSMKIQTLGYSDSPGLNNDDDESNNVPVANISIGAGLLTDAEHISTGYCGEGYVYIASPIIFSGNHNSYSTYDGCDVQFGTGSDKKCKVDFTYANVVGLDIDTVAKFG